MFWLDYWFCDFAINFAIVTSLCRDFAIYAVIFCCAEP